MTGGSGRVGKFIQEDLGGSRGSKIEMAKGNIQYVQTEDLPSSHVCNDIVSSSGWRS